MVEQLDSAITYLVTLSSNSEEVFLPSKEPCEPIVMDFDSEYFSED
jgi:hypothetical protein